MQKNYTNTTSTHVLLMYLFVFGLSLIVQNVQAQSCQLMQGHNGGIGLPVVSPLDFQRGNSNHSKAHFEEGNSVPYKIEFGTLQPNVQYKVRIGFDVKKNGKYALDYLTGFQNLQFNASDVAESVQPLIGSSLENVSGITANYFPIPSPQFSSVASFNTTASASFQNLKSSSLNPEVTVPSSDISASVKNKGNMGIWNATINSINYVGNVNTAGQTESVYVEVVFTKANNMNAVLLAWGGHIASIADWGLGNSASAIPGSPYHMYVDYISTTGTTPNIICSGNMDCQTASASIVVPPTCSITGPNTLCGGTISSVYTATLDAAQNGTVSYLWSLTNQSPSAGAQLTGTISDSTNAVTVTGTVIPISTYFNEGGNFMLRLRVERKGVIDYCYYNSIDSPGAFIHVNAIAASASATPSSYSLNETSTSNLSVNVKLEGIDSNAAFTYHWTRMGTGGAIGASLSDENSRTPTLTATLAGTYNYKVIVTQIAAPYCIDSATVSVVVSPLQQCPDVLTDAVCAGAVNNVYVASFLPDQNVTYNWTVNNGATIVYNNNADTIKVNAGSGNFDIQLKMSYANPNANDNYCTYPVTVNPLPIINTGSYSPLCADASPITLSGTPSGGTWSGTGVSGDQFTPSSAGTFKVKYSYTDANGCSNADSTNITVNAIPTVSAGSYSPLCADASPITLSGTPSGGTWSGTGVSGNQFTPSSAGTFKVKYSYTDANGCSNADSTNITVNANPTVSAGSYSPLCSDASPITLSGTPSGGTWSGTGVSGDQFTPSSAGTFKVKYSYTDANGCSNADSTNITVNANPTVSAGSYSPLCKDASPITLSGTPSGGTWSGTGVSGSEFTPSGAGTFKVKYSYTDANGCSNADSTNITVNANPTVSAGSYSPLCADASPITLSGTPSGGTWSGTGVSGSEFTPSGAGTFKVKYSYTDANGCSNADSTNITVNANPTVSAGSYSPLCADASPITLSGTPSGGTWSGTGVSGSEFTPSGVGTFKVKYSYTDANGCSNADSTNITVNANPTVSAGSYSPLCKDASPITLSGTPSGGTWSGTGVSGDQFTPSTEGTFKVKYNYTDANGCSGADSVNITVKVCQYVNACTVTQGYYGSTNGNMCDEDSIYTGAVSFIRKLLSSGPITIGSGVRTLTIQVTDSARVNAILPGGGTPTTFTHTGNIYLTSSQFSNYLTKQGKINNILLSQTITLALNVRIKSDLNGLVLHNGYIHTQKLKACNGNGVVSCEEDPSAIQAWPMKSSVVDYLTANGGATVSNLLNLANAVLGRTKIPGQSGSGGTVVPSLGDIVSQVDVINNAFDKCRLFLDFESSPNLCPGLTISNFNKEEIAEKTQSNGLVNKVAVELVKEFKVSAYPNPFNDIIKFSIESPSEMKIAIELYDMNGRNLGKFYEGSILPNERKLIQINSPSVTGQIVYRVVTPTKVITGTLLKLEK